MTSCLLATLSLLLLTLHGLVSLLPLQHAHVVSLDVGGSDVELVHLVGELTVLALHDGGDLISLPGLFPQQVMLFSDLLEV